MPHQRYGDEEDMLLDIVRPASASEPLPLVMWVHGGGWVGGSKDELSGYFKLIASHGYLIANVSSAFPPALITVGNADPLRPHSELLADRLRATGAEVDTVFWPVDHQPPLGHEYQFDLDTQAGQYFLDRMLTFLRQRLAVALLPEREPRCGLAEHGGHRRDERGHVG